MRQGKLVSTFFILLVTQKGVADKSPQLLFLIVYENYLIDPLIYLFVTDQQILLVKFPQNNYERVPDLLHVINRLSALTHLLILTPSHDHVELPFRLAVTLIFYLSKKQHSEF